jgi:hypothetical protein
VVYLCLRCGIAAAEEAVRDAFSMAGGVSIASGNRNQTSSKNILAWDKTNSQPYNSNGSGNNSNNSSSNSLYSPGRSHGRGSSASSSPCASSANIGYISDYNYGTGGSGSPGAGVVSLPYQDNYAVAGSPTVRSAASCVRKQTPSSASMLSKSVKPYGTDDSINARPTTPGGSYNNGSSSNRSSPYDNMRSSPVMVAGAPTSAKEAVRTKKIFAYNAHSTSSIGFGL